MIICAAHNMALDSLYQLPVLWHWVSRCAIDCGSDWRIHLALKHLQLPDQCDGGGAQYPWKMESTSPDYFCFGSYLGDDRQGLLLSLKTLNSPRGFQFIFGAGCVCWFGLVRMTGRAVSLFHDSRYR